MTRVESTTIEDRAANWVAREDRGALALGEQADLNAWLAGDPRHKGAYVRARALWLALDLSADAAPTTPYPIRRPTLDRRGALTAGGALLAASVAGVGAFQLLGARGYATDVGEVRQSPLDDGSRMMLDTASAASARITHAVRLVRLRRGQAWFDVARDQTRPFVVQADRVRVRAVGTAFLVRCLPNSAQVLVSEGVVEVWNVTTPEKRLRLTAGEGARLAQSGDPPPIASVLDEGELDRTLAWRTGEIVLNGETIAQAAAEFNRYNRIQIVVEDSPLAHQPLIGSFRATDPHAFARTAAIVLGARISEQDQTIFLRSRAS